MNIIPFAEQSECRACGYKGHAYTPAFRYCESICIPDGFGGWLGCQVVPHLHRTCERCSYSWLMHTKMHSIEQEQE